MALPERVREERDATRRRARSRGRNHEVQRREREAAISEGARRPGHLESARLLAESEEHRNCRATMPSATVAISQAFEPRRANGEPRGAHQRAVDRAQPERRAAASGSGQPQAPREGGRRTPRRASSKLPCAKFTVADTA